MYASAEKRVWTWRSPKNGTRNGSYRVHGSRVSVRGHGGCAPCPAAGPQMAMASTSPSRVRVDTRNPSDTGRLVVKLQRGDAGGTYIVRSDRTPGGCTDRFDARTARGRPGDSRTVEAAKGDR